VHGGIRVRPTGPTLETLTAGAELVARGRAGERNIVLTGRSGAPPHIILTFAGIESRDEAAELSGSALLAPADALPPIEEEATFYVRDLIGCVVEVEGSAVGMVSDVVPGAANDALEIERDGSRTLIPFIDAAIVELDVPARRIAVRERFLLGE
jgi:16S rRNA processing protein RimM